MILLVKVRISSDSVYQFESHLGDIMSWEEVLKKKKENLLLIKQVIILNLRCVRESLTE